MRQVTDFTSPQELISTSKGYIPYGLWCLHLAAKLIKKGIFAEVLQYNKRKYKEYSKTCHVMVAVFRG